MKRFNAKCEKILSVKSFTGESVMEKIHEDGAIVPSVLNNVKNSAFDIE